MSSTKVIDAAVLTKSVKANEESLINQSRSFAIPILNLDDRFKIPIMVEYNLNKTIDTIEDSTQLEADEKIELIKAFCEDLQHDKFSAKIRKRMLEVTPEEEAFVFKNYEATISLYNTLSKKEKDLAKRWTTEMAKGMCVYLTRAINSLEDLNKYCYYVAGTVGIYLTTLLKLKGSNINENDFRKLKDNAVSFGLFQQKLNIIRDFVEDQVTKKRCFWPQSYFEYEKDHVKILNRMCYETLINDMPRAVKYFREIPPGNDSYDYFIRFILCSGIEYWKILKDNKMVFSETKVKLPRMFIEKLYEVVSSQTRKEFESYCDQFIATEISARSEFREKT